MRRIDCLPCSYSEDGPRVAARMQAIAARMQCGEILTDRAVAEALRSYHATGDAADALNDGIHLIQRARAGWPPERAEDRALLVDDELRLIPSLRSDPTATVTLCACAALLAALIAWGIA